MVTLRKFKYASFANQPNSSLSSGTFRTAATLACKHSGRTECRVCRNELLSAGDSFFRAPENRGGHSVPAQSSDMWSLGAVVYFLLVGELPDCSSETGTPAPLCETLFSPSNRKWTGLTTEAKDFITRLLKVDPVERLTAKHALAHSWWTAARGSSGQQPRVEATKSLQLALARLQMQGSP